MPSDFSKLLLSVCLFGEGEGGISSLFIIIVIVTVVVSFYLILYPSADYTTTTLRNLLMSLVERWHPARSVNMARQW
jgi:hypothetical protein